METINIWDAIQTGGVLGLLVVIIVTGLRGSWVFGWQYRDLKADRDKLWDLTVTANSLAVRGADVTDRAVTTQEAIVTEVNKVLRTREELEHQARQLAREEAERVMRRQGGT